MPFLSRLQIVAVFLLSLLVLGSSLAQAAPGQVQWSVLDSRLQSLSQSSNLLVAEFRGNSCQTIHGRDQGQTLAIASTFKLYVLGELARQIQIGEASWDEQIKLTDELRSMPSGDYAFMHAGTSVGLLHLAEAMIWQSDNTATDHLINRLGRENVQRAFQAFGHGDPALKSPLLLTKEMFGIKMNQSPEWMSTWQAATEDVQMQMLAETIDPMRINPGGGWGYWNGPTAIGGIEWFASADDLCRATAALWSMGAQTSLEPVRQILTGNRYGVTDTGTWPRAGYKGGYEAGVVNMTFVLERNDGRVFFVSAGYNDPVRVMDTATARIEIDPVFGCLKTYSESFSCGLQTVAAAIVINWRCKEGLPGRTILLMNRRDRTANQATWSVVIGVLLSVILFLGAAYSRQPLAGLFIGISTVVYLIVLAVFGRIDVFHVLWGETVDEESPFINRSVLTLGTVAVAVGSIGVLMYDLLSTADWGWFSWLGGMIAVGYLMSFAWSARQSSRKARNVE